MELPKSKLKKFITAYLLIALIILVVSLFTEGHISSDHTSKNNHVTSSSKNQNAETLCRIFRNTDMSNGCVISNEHKTVTIGMNTNKSEAKKICSGVALQVSEDISLTDWTLKIKDEYGTNELAKCELM